MAAPEAKTVSLEPSPSSSSPVPLDLGKTRARERVRDMEFLRLPGSAPTALPFSQTLSPSNTSPASHSQPCLPSPLRPRLAANCRGRTGEDGPLSTSSAHDVLGVERSCSAAELKAAFRAKVKQYHPDVRRDGDSETMIRRVIQAYQILSNYSRSEIIERECLDPFDKPECEALDLFVNELLCAGKGCPYPCVKTAPQAFTFSTYTGTAQASSQGTGEDYQVQAAVAQCPRSCIHYVTPSQRIVLEELLDSIIDAPYDTSAEADLLYSLIVKARFENNRYRKPKKQPRNSSKHVDWY